MKKKTKTLIFSIVFTLVLLLTFTITYAVFTYQETGENNQQLVLGDIYMHYNESNTIIDVNNMMPINLYQANPVMKTNELNELEKCISYFSYAGFDAGSTALTYCQGIGTLSGQTLQNGIENNRYTRNDLLNLGVVIQDGTSYLVNPIMATQEVESELGSCINTLINIGITRQTEQFCLGSSEYKGYKFNELLNSQYFNETDLIELIDKNIVIKNNDNLSYFEFSVSGLNTYKKEDIYYEILLNHGEQPDDKTLRIDDKLLRFSLVEVNGDEEIILLENRSYESIENKRIWVETINKNTLSEVSKTYRLYMWIADEITICGGELSDGCDYYTSGDENNWNQVFASVKVGVHGDFREKNVSQDEACFTYEEVPDISEIYIYEYDGEYRTYNLNTTPEGVLACMDFMMEQFDEDASAKKDRFESFCNGVGTIYFDSSIYEYLYYYVDDDVMDSLVAKNIFIPVENGEIMVEITDYDITCGRDVVVPGTLNGKKVVSLGDSSFNKKGINSIDLPNTLKVIKFSALYKNALTHIELPDSLIYIGSYAINSNELQEIKFPESLKMIGAQAFYANQLTNIEIPLNSNLFIEVAAFGVNNLSESQAYIYGSYGDKIIGENPTTLVSYGGTNKNIVIPNDVTKLSEYSFGGSSIENIEISDSVTTIGKDAFNRSKLETVTIGSGIQYIDRGAFNSDSSSNPNLSSITFTSKTCAEIRNIQASENNIAKYFPWSAYKASIYGTDGECSY